MASRDSGRAHNCLAISKRGPLLCKGAWLRVGNLANAPYAVRGIRAVALGNDKYRADRQEGYLGHLGPAVRVVVLQYAEPVDPDVSDPEERGKTHRIAKRAWNQLQRSECFQSPGLLQLLEVMCSQTEVISLVASHITEHGERFAGHRIICVNHARCIDVD